MAEVTDGNIESLLRALRENDGSLRVDYSRHNRRNLEIIGAAEAKGFVTTRVIDHYEAQWSEIEVRLNT